MAGQETKKSELGITVKKEDDMPEWYSQIIQKAELADHAPIKGFMVIRPNAYSMWEKIQDYFNSRLKEHNIRNAYFPLLIPESFFQREAEHAEGFSPELAWVSKKDDEDSERLAIRPTSETIMYDSYSSWKNDSGIRRGK
jgi:prolyl-tRNA synthetase